jgi:hypothetical protein
MKAEEVCNHWLGWIHEGTTNQRIYSGNYITYCEQYSKDMNETNEHFSEVLGSSLYPKRGKFTPSSIIDNRRGLSTLFQHCPNCGCKINWRKLRKELKERL